jgi:AcrR family transcriptional regulator
MGIEERRERERAARRAAVLEAARELVREKGFNATTTRDIAERCELSEATLFWYFKSKDEIFTSLLFEGIDFMSRGIEEIRASAATPRRKLERVWRFFSAVRAEHPEYYHVFTYLAHPQATQWVDDGVKTELARRSGDDFRGFAELLRETAGPANARLVADLIWGAFIGLQVLYHSRLNLGVVPHPNERELMAAFRLLLAGIAPELAAGTSETTGAAQRSTRRAGSSR